ncbi:MAG: DUF2341 domain-containing protein [Candidatus Hodarchaeales archaeon]
MRLRIFQLRHIVLLTILTLNVFTLMINLSSVLGGEAEGFTADLLRGLGIPVQNEDSLKSSVPRLTSVDLANFDEKKEINPVSIASSKIVNSFSLPTWGGAGFMFRKNLTIDSSKVLANLNDFPVLIDLYGDKDLFGVRQSTGYDIMFTDASGNKLDHEVESFEQEIPRLIAWVKTDLLSSTDTTISMYFGNDTIPNQANPTGVWANNYEGIYHLSEDPTGTIYDSTANNNDGTSTGSMTSSDQVEGIFDGSVDFDGSNDLINIGDVNSNSWTGVTAQAWIFHDTTGDDRIICKSPSGVTAEHIISLAVVNSGSNDRLRVRLSTDGIGGSAAISRDSVLTFTTGTWHHVAFTWDSASERIYLYIDGSQDSNNYFKDGDSIDDSTLPVILANVNTGADDRYYDGKIDEARLSNVARSANWIGTEFNNQYSPYSFYSVGALEEPPSSELYRFRKDLVIDNTKVSGSSDLSQINVLFDIYDTDLRKDGRIQSSGDNLVFKNQGTTKELYYEVEEWNQLFNTTHAHLRVWVQVDTLYANTETLITLYYGNQANYGYHSPSTVWNDYLGVWHLDESVNDEGTAVNAHTDSTANTNHGNQHGNDDSIGVVGTAQNFDGTNDYVEMGDIDILDLNELNTDSGVGYLYTLSGWIYRASSSNTDVIIDKTQSDIDDFTGYTLYINQTDGKLYFIASDDDDDGYFLNSISNFNLMIGSWHHFTITFDTGVSTSNWNLFIDGTNDTAIKKGYGPPAGASLLWMNGFVTSAPFTLGATSGNSDFFDGKIDDIRFSQQLLSSDHIATEFTNLDDPSSFYSVASEVENSNWWLAESYGRKKDIIIDSGQLGQTDENVNMKPWAPGYTQTWNHYNRFGVVQDYLAVDEVESDDDGSFIYSSIDASNRYSSFKLKGLQNEFSGSITSITLHSRVRRRAVSGTGSVFSSNIRVFVRPTSVNYYGSSRWAGTGYTSYSDAWSTNPVTGQPWSWDDLSDLEIGVRGYIDYNQTETVVELRITQLYAEITYTRDKDIFNFPLSLDIYDSDLKTDVQPDADDIVFYDTIGRKLDHDMTFDQDFNATHAHLLAHINIPRISISSNTIISMYYGNSTIGNQQNPDAVWDDLYSASWHLDELGGGTDTIKDATSNNNTGTDFGSPTFGTLGVAGTSIRLDGDVAVDDYISIADDPSLRYDTFLTVSAWINPDVTSVWQTIISKMDGQTEHLYFVLDNTNLYIGLHPIRVDWNTGISVTSGTWTHVAVTYNGETIRVYKNGILSASSFGEGILSLESNSNPLYIGYNEGWPNEIWDGFLDEIRLSRTARSTDWLKLTYLNQIPSSTLLTISSENDHAAPVIIDFGIDDPGDGQPIFWANVTDHDASVSSVTLNLNGTYYLMSQNGSGFWIYQPVGVSYGDYYDYQIVNASDTVGNYLTIASIEKNITFYYDSILPGVIDWDYYSGTKKFKANVSDTWGVIDTVIINVTYHENMADTSSLWAIMQNTASGFQNDTIIMIEGTMNFVITVNDTYGNSFTSSEHPGFVLNTPPEASSLNLSQNSSSVLLPVTSNDTLYFLYIYNDAELDPESGSEIRWEKWNDTHWNIQSAYNDLNNITAGALTRDDVWRVQFRPNDGKDFGDWYISGNITIENTVPIAFGTVISPSMPTTNSTLVAEYSWLDVDSGDTETGSQIRWYRDNGNGSGFLLLSQYNDLLQLPENETTKGDQFYFTITPGDGIGLGNTYTSTTITILNTPPTLIVKLNDNAQPATVANDTDLDATYQYSDVDGDSINLTSLEIRWWRFNLTTGKFESVVNGTFTILSTSTNTSELWRVDMWVNDGTDYSEWTSSATISIGVAPNQAPSAFYVNLTSSNPVAGGSLYANYTYYDPEGDSESLTTFRWYKNGIYQPQFDGIRNLLTATLIKGDNWTVEVRPQDNKNDYGEWNSSQPIIILNTVPVVVTAEIFPATNVYTSSTLLINYQGTDIDEDSIITISVVWINGSQEIVGLYNETEVPSSYLKKGETWKYVLRIFDGTNWSANKTSETITVLNSLMSFDSVSLSGGADTLEDIGIGYSYTDLDSDLINLGQTKINWTIEFASGGNLSVDGVWTLSNTYFVAGDTVTVEITPHDGESLGVTWQPYRTRLIIGNAIPTISGQPNILGPENTTDFYASDELHLNYTATDPDFGESSPLYNIDYDPDGYVVGAEYRWYRNGNKVSELNTHIVPIAYLVRGDEWKASVKPRDRFGDFGPWVNSTVIIITNSRPLISEFREVNPYTTSDMNLDIEFTYSDYDGDPINLSNTIIQWYKYSTLIVGTEITVISTEQVGNEYIVVIRLFSDHYIRGDNITVEVQPHDGTEWALQSNTSFGMIIGNARPYAFNVNLQPNGTDTTAYTTDNLNVSWLYSDPDNDLEVTSLAKIIWKNKGIPQSMFENQSSILSDIISKGDVWTVEIFVFDGMEWSKDPKISAPLIVENTPPIIISVAIISDSGNTSETYADTNLEIDFFDGVNYTDVDGDFILYFGTITRWYRNGIHQSSFDNAALLPSSVLFKGDYWYVEVQITDDLVVYSLNQTSQNITIVNKAPTVISVTLTGNEYIGFFVESEDVSISISVFDVDTGDSELSYITWSVNGVYNSLYDNLHTIPSNATQAGDTWNATILASDGFDNATSFAFFSLFIESRPKIHNFTTTIVKEEIDGTFIFSIEMTDALDYDILLGRYDVHLNKSGTLVKTGFLDGNATHWFFVFELLDYADGTYFNTSAIITITAQSIIGVTTIASFNFTLIDGVAPRIKTTGGSSGVWYEKDIDPNPTNLTFYAAIEEYGSGVSSVVLYYYLNLVESEGDGSSIVQEDNEFIPLEMSYLRTEGETLIYTVSVEYIQDGNDYEPLFFVSTSDVAGNSNPNAFDIRNHPERIELISFQPGGLPPELLMLAGLAVFLIFIGAIVYVRFIRKPEIVGLDKELVMKGVADVDEEEIIADVDRHTLGLVVSFFDQLHGPIPIIVIPEMLKDNYSKLVALSDRSFSGTGFSDDYTSEVPSSYDFVLGEQLRISVMSFGFALDKPDARGGQENLTMNILVHKDIFNLVEQFKDEIQEKVHNFHMTMASDSGNKVLIRVKANEVRKYVSAIILSYVNIYGTTDLIEDDED